MGQALAVCVEDDPTLCNLSDGLLPDLPCKKILKDCDEIEMRCLTNLYKEFDNDEDGAITRVELREALVRFGKNPTKRSIDKMIYQLDIHADSGRAKSPSLFSFGSSPQVARAKTLSDGHITFADFSRGMLARNSLLYKFLYAGYDNSEEEHEAERMANQPKKRNSVFSMFMGGDKGTPEKKGSVGEDLRPPSISE